MQRYQGVRKTSAKYLHIFNILNLAKIAKISTFIFIYILAYLIYIIYNIYYIYIYIYIYIFVYIIHISAINGYIFFFQYKSEPGIATTPGICKQTSTYFVFIPMLSIRDLIPS